MNAEELSENSDDSSRGSVAAPRGSEEVASLREAFTGFRNLVRHLHRYEQLRSGRTAATATPPVQTQPPEPLPIAAVSPAMPEVDWEALFAPLHESLLKLTRDVQTLRDELPREVAALAADSLAGSFEHLSDRMDRLSEAVQTSCVAAPSTMHDAAPELESFPTAPIADRLPPELLEAVFGEDVGKSPELRIERDRLLDGLMRQDPHAGCFVGYLLLFQFAAVSERPRILRPLGEAFYRWCPKDNGTQIFETAVIGWVNRRCQQVGLSLRVEAVTLNCRFDAERHHAAGQAGRDVTDVLGWVVRSQDRIFDRAMVGVH